MQNFFFSPQGTSFNLYSPIKQACLLLPFAYEKAGTQVKYLAQSHTIGVSVVTLVTVGSEHLPI